MSKKILISNDDGIDAQGLKVLVEIAGHFGDVIVVAPNSPRSGAAMALSASEPIRLYKHKPLEGSLLSYACSGTPVDCVKIAFDKILDFTPDMVLSGINHGSNTSISVLYSGTMGVAIEGCIHDIPSIGFSFCCDNKELDFSAAKPYIASIISKVLDEKLPQGTCLSVNIPQGKINGIVACPLGHGRWMEEFSQRKDPYGSDYYWVTGYFKNFEEQPINNDYNAVENNYIAISPVKIDLSDRDFLSELSNMIKDM